MAQHFLLSAAARTLSLKSIFSEGEEAAYRRFCQLRWPEARLRRSPGRDLSVRERGEGTVRGSDVT